MSKPKQTYVVGFMFDKDASLRNNEHVVLLIEKTKPAWQAGKLNGVGGKIESGEKPIEAMVREFREETGISTKEADWGKVFNLVGPDYEVYFFRAVGDIRKYRNMTEEKLAIVGVRTLGAHPNVIYNLRWMLPLCLDTSIQFPLTINDRVPDAESRKHGDKLISRVVKVAVALYLVYVIVEEVWKAV